MRFFGVVDEYVLDAGGGIRSVEVAQERALGGVVVPAAGVDQAVSLVGRLLHPLRGHEKVGLDLEKPLEHKREAGGGRLAERENLQVVVVQAEVPPVALDRGFGEIEV